MKKGTLGRILLALVALFLAIQLVPVWALQTNPPVAAEPRWDTPTTRALAKQACFDCHSNETVWPIYARIAPISWLITNDVRQGRSRLNFSEWQAGAGSLYTEEIARVISSGRMPPGQYALLHPPARLTDAERLELTQGLQASLK